MKRNDNSNFEIVKNRELDRRRITDSFIEYERLYGERTDFGNYSYGAGKHKKKKEWKLWRLIYHWILISVVLQCVVLLFLDQVYLKRSDDRYRVYETNEVDIGDFVKVTIDPGAGSPRISYNTEYIGYILNGAIEVFSIKESKIIKKINPVGYSITYFCWAPDRNFIIYAAKSETQMQKNVILATYDCSSGAEYEVSGNEEYKNIWKSFPFRTEIVDLQFSVANNVYYFKTIDSKKRVQIFKCDRMNQLFHIMDYDPTIMKQFNYADMLVMQDKSNSLSIWDGIKGLYYKCSAFNGKRVALLDISPNDNVYVGELDSNDNVIKIYKGKGNLNQKKSWEDLGKPKFEDESSRFIITKDEKIFYIDEKTGLLNGVFSDEKYKFKGEFIEIKNGYIVSIKDNTIRIEKI